MLRKLCKCGCGKDPSPGKDYISGHNWNGKKHSRQSIDKMSGENGSRWSGGRSYSEGYVRVFCPSHPYATDRGYVYEHRLVMEAHLGRVLLPTEIVHHINGIKDDNRIENLALFSKRADHVKEHGGIKRKT